MQPHQAHLAAIQPVVLVGGKSSRFGRDKLREPMHDGVLVQRPINALRSVFGPRVMLVGDCDPTLLPLADGIIHDRHPGVGPIGGVISALACANSPVFVAAGDMPNIDAATINALLAAFATNPAALALFAGDPAPHPTLAIYRAESLPILRERLARHQRALHSALPADRVVLVQCDPRALANVNTPGDKPL
ncbi:MAG: molybdenum cofactor guanylyltransferase [Phycisphaerales bacterium]|jgi:molybdopterin-guanine dinucleotide biosynthesis protein A|nr:molybdenum cofactor guanylyltransferase [Phycisphaerales bacterium]